MKWKPLAAACILTLAAGATLPAASLATSAHKGKEGAVSKDDVRKAIAIFRRNPTSVQGEMTQPIILSFAKESPDVEVALSDKRLPWVEDKTTPSETGTALTVAYLAGDIVAQLDKGTTKDDPLAATKQVIETYRQLQEADSKLKVPSVEKLITLQKQGKLAEYFKGD